MDKQEQDFLQGLENELGEQRTKNIQLNQSLASMSPNEDNNLIQYQLDPGELLGRLEHFLRGDYISVDKEGNEYWKKQKNKKLVLFNEYGINSLMIIIGNYVDKNTMLSNYDEMRINQILADLGDELTTFIFCNYEHMGMDSKFKKTRYALTVVSILNAIESTYRRALRGSTMKDLNSTNIVTQSEALNQRTPMMQTKRKFHPFRPKTW